MLAAALLVHPAAAATGDVPPRVVVSILPLHSLAAEVMRGVGEPQLLLQGGQSPHTTQLAPSQSRALDDADLIIWVGPALESPLAKSIDNAIAQRDAAHVITLLQRDEIELLPLREGGVWAAHDHDHGHDDHGDADDEHDDHADDLHRLARIDPHLWLSTANAVAIVDIIARELARIDPANADRYDANAHDLNARIAELRRELHADLDAVREAPFIVFHDAYQYFDREFALRPAGSLTESPDRLPGAKRMREIAEAIRARDVRCAFSEPQFPPALMDAVRDGTDAKAGVLDPVGAALRPGPGAWFALMRALADSLRECLR